MVIASSLAIQQDRAVEDAERADLAEVINLLNRTLGHPLVAMIAAVPKTADLSGVIADPKKYGAAVVRLRHAYAVVTFILDVRRSGEAVATPDALRIWFMGMNPGLAGKSPISAIGDEFRQVLAAAYSYVAGDFN